MTHGATLLWLSLLVLTCCCHGVYSQVGTSALFSFCHITTTTGVLTYNTWSAVMVGTFNGTLQSTSQRGNIYLVTSVTGYRNVSSLAGDGTVASTIQMTGVDNSATALGNADNLLTYPSEFTFTDTSGITIKLASPSPNDLTGCNGVNAINIFSDTQLECGVNNAAGAVSGSSYGALTVVAGATPPTCIVPTRVSQPAAANSPSTTNFAFCLSTFDTSLVPGISVWSSLVSGVMSTTSTANSNLFTVTSITGWRAVSSISSPGTLASNTSISLTPLSQCSGCSNLISLATSTPATDSNGIGITLGATQSDSLGCSTGAFLIVGTSIVCAQNPSVRSSSTLSIVAGTSISCTPPAPPTTYGASTCGVGTTSLSSLGNADLSYTDCVTGGSISMRLCQGVANPSCVAAFGGNSMVCLTLGTTAYTLASNYSGLQNNELTFSYNNGRDLSAGIAYSTASGDACGSQTGIRRAVSGVITCGCQNQIISFQRTGTCAYTINLNSPAACSSTPPSCPAVNTTLFNFCHTLSTTSGTPVAVINGTLSTVPSLCGGYAVQSVTASRYVATSSGIPSSVVVSSTLDTVLGSPDSLIRFPLGGNASTYTDASGLSFSYPQQFDSVCGYSNTFNVYDDTSFNCGTNDIEGSASGQGALAVGYANGSALSCPLPSNLPKNAAGTMSISLIFLTSLIAVAAFASI